MQKLTVINAREYLAKENQTYQTYMGMLKNGYGGDDQKAIDAMHTLEQEHINSQAASGGSWRWIYEIAIACILSLLVNACFGIAVARHYKLVDLLESYGIDLDYYEESQPPITKPQFASSPAPAEPITVLPEMTTKTGNGIQPELPPPAPSHNIVGQSGFKIPAGFQPPQHFRAEEKPQPPAPLSPTPPAVERVVEKTVYINQGPDIEHARDERLKQAHQRFIDFKKLLNDNPNKSQQWYADGLKCDRTLISKMKKAISEGKNWP